MQDLHHYAVFLLTAVAIVALNLVMGRARVIGKPGAKVGLGDVQTIMKHVRQLDQAAIDRMHEMNSKGASSEDISRAIFPDYDSCSDGEKRALCMVVDKMRTGNVAVKTNFSVQTRQELFKLDKDALARARQLHADGADTDGICRDVIKDYSGWDSGHQERAQQAMNKFLEKS